MEVAERLHAARASGKKDIVSSLVARGSPAASEVAPSAPAVTIDKGATDLRSSQGSWLQKASSARGEPALAASSMLKQHLRRRAALSTLVRGVQAPWTGAADAFELWPARRTVGFAVPPAVRQVAPSLR